MKLLVTGASGFIGKNLLLKIPKKWEVVATYYKTASFVQFIEKERLRNVQAIQVNLTNFSETREKLNSVGSNFDVAIHLAANTDISLSVREPETDLYCNVTTLVNTIKSSKIKDVIFISSGAIYDGNKGKVSPKIPLRPSFPYAISKLAAEHYLVYMKKYRLIDKYLILRFFGAYGPYEPPRKLFTKLVNAFYFEKKREFMVVGDGNNLIDAMYVEDTIRGLLSAIKTDKRDIIVDFTYGNPLTVNQLVMKAAEIFDIDSVNIKHEGHPIEYITFYASDKQQKLLFDFEPSISLEEGFWRLAKWLEKNRKKKYA